MDIKLKKDIVDRIKKHVKAGKYESIDDFTNKAAESLLMAEDRVGKFTQVFDIKKE
tara:strand:+ start:332 stop:499 length:168 start_codon:yes stop_codon:yes gene_type:complete